MPISLNSESTGGSAYNISGGGGTSGVDIETLFSYVEVSLPSKPDTKFVIYEGPEPKTIKMSNFIHWDFRSTDLRVDISNAIQYTAGDVYIGNSASPNTNLYVYNDIGCKGTLSVLLTTIPSDIRLKENVEPILNAIDKVKELNGVYFNYKDKPDMQRLTGVIAQDVEKVIPEAIKVNDYGVE